MAQYRLEIKKSVSKDLKGLPSADVKRILVAIAALADDPRPPQSKKLSGRGEYRLRQGNYRILYSIDDGLLVVCVV